jgi:hypothetical protein
MHSQRFRSAASSAALIVLGTVFGIAPASFGAVQHVLHSQGPLITSPTGGTGAIAGQPLSKAETFPLTPTLNGTTTGVGATRSVNTAAADDFDVPEAGWDIDSIKLYAFQTYPSSATTFAPTITKIYVNLWNATPYLPDSPDLPPGTPIPTPLLAAALSFDVTAADATFVGHRVSGSSTTTVRPIYSYTVSADGLPNGGQLDPGHYWLEFAFDGVGPQTSTVFVPLVTPRDSVDSAPNARLLNAPFGGSQRTWFEGREGFNASTGDPGRAYTLPFELIGVPEPVTLLTLGAALPVAAIRRKRR